MEEKFELSNGDCRRYYELVKDKMSPEYSEINNKPSFIVNKVDNEVEDLDLGFNDTSDRSNNNVPLRKATIRCFVSNNEDNEEIEGSDEDDNEMPNNDGHYIMDDDAWSDYWDNGEENISNGTSKFILNPVEPKETLVRNSLAYRGPQIEAVMGNGSIDKNITNLKVKIIYA